MIVTNRPGQGCSRRAVNNYKVQEFLKKIPKPKIEEPKQLHAFYSDQSAALYGFCVYIDLKGNEVKITEVSDSRTPAGRWLDQKYLGLVTDRCIEINDSASWNDPDFWNDPEDQ